MTELLEPLYVITMKLQESDLKTTDFYVDSVDFIKSEVTKQSALIEIRDDVLALFEKWCGDNNEILLAYHGKGQFYEVCLLT